MVNLTLPSETYLLEIDRQLAESGVLQHARPFHAAIEWIRSNSVGFGRRIDMEFVREFCAAYEKVVPGYPCQGSGTGVGFVASGDLIKLVKLPMVFGTAALTPQIILGFKNKDEWYKWCRSDNETITNSIHVSADIWDIASSAQMNTWDGDVSILWQKCREQLAALAVILEATIDPQSSLQPLHMSVEHAIKCGLLKTGFTKNRLKNEIGHDLQKGFSALANSMADGQDDLVRKIIGSIPSFVKYRYEKFETSKAELVRLAVAAQFVCANIFRRFGASNISKEFSRNPQLRPRTDMKCFKAS